MLQSCAAQEEEEEEDSPEEVSSEEEDSAEEDSTLQKGYIHVYSCNECHDNNWQRRGGAASVEGAAFSSSAESTSALIPASNPPCS